MKFQWSKVASVLGSYKDFIHAYGLSVNSANFSQGQIADQLDTIDRRLQQLKATFTSVATGVGSSGLSKFIKDTLVNINALVQAFQRVPSGVYSAIATMIKWGTLLVGTVGTLSLVAKGIVGMQMALKAATTAQAAETLATNVSTASKVKNLAMRVLGVNAMRAQATASAAATAGLVAEGAAAQGAAVATGELATGVTVATAGLNLLIAALAVAVLGFMGYTSIMGSAIQKQDELAQKQKDDITAKEQQIGALERENEWIGVLCENHGKLQKALDETKEGTEQHTKAEEDLKATDQELAEVIGEDAASNIDWSKGWQAVMEEEKGTHNQKIQAMRKDLVAAKEAQLAYTQNQINWTKDRIKALENEGNSWVALKNVIESFVHMLGSALIKIADFAETARNAIKDVPALGKIVGFFGGDINTLGSGAISGARDKGAAMQGWKAPDMLVNGFNYALSVTPGIQIPWLANKVRDLKRENELEYQKGDLERLEKQYNEEKADWLGAKINSYKNGTDSGIVPENEGKGGGGGRGAGAGKGRGGQEADNSDEAMGYRYLLGKGLDKNFIFGLLANINNESSFNPDADNGSHRGLIQWDYNDSSRTGRWYDFMDDYLLTMRKISEEEYNAMDKNQKRALQYDFIIYEMRRGKEQEAYQRIIDAVPTTPEQYAHLINRHYERSGEYSGGTDWARQKDARAYAERFGRKNGELNYSDGEKAIADNYKQAKKLYEDKLKDLELERSKEGQKVSAREKRNLYESMMGIGKDGNPFAVLQDATNDYKKLLVDEAKEIAKGQEYAKKSAETQAQAVEKMADAEIAFAEKLGLLNKSDVRKYEWDKNESNYAKQKPLADARLGATVALDRGTAEDMLEAYQNYVYAKDELEAEFYAKRIFYLSSDVEATKKALNEEFKLEQSYRDKRRSLNEEEFAYRARYVTTFIDSLTNGIQEGLEGILNRTKSFADAFRDIFKGVVQDIIKLFSKDFAERIHKWLSKAIFKQKETGNPAGSFADLGGILGGGKKTSGKSVGGGGAFDIVGWAQSSLSSLGGGMGKGKGKGNVLVNALGLNNFAASVKSAVQPGLLMLRNQAQLTVQGISNVSQQGMQMMYTGLQTGTQMMGVTYQGYKVTQVATEQMGNAAIVADSQATAATVQATTAQMMAWIMAVLALFSLFGGGGGSSTETSTSSVNLGRSPDSYYMTPTPVMQSTTFNVPSFDIGGNIEQDMFAMVHKGEMVLTPEQANVIRETARNSGSMGNGGNANANVKSNITVSTVDSRGFDRVLRNYNRDLSKQVKKGIRNGYLTAKGLV